MALAKTAAYAMALNGPMHCSIPNYIEDQNNYCPLPDHTFSIACPLELIRIGRNNNFRLGVQMRFFAYFAALFMVWSVPSHAVSFVDDGDHIRFSDVMVGSTEAQPVEFSLGYLGRDEAFDTFVGPNFSILSGSGSVFSMSNTVCEQIGIGIVCLSDLLFSPDAVGSFSAMGQISASLSFVEIHGAEAGEYYTYSDRFRFSLSGAGLAAVPLPSSFSLAFVAIGLLAIRRRYHKPTAQNA